MLKSRLSSPSISPWYNRTGWLGVKHQFTCLLTPPASSVFLHYITVQLFSFIVSDIATSSLVLPLPPPPPPPPPHTPTPKTQYKISVIFSQCHLFFHYYSYSCNYFKEILGNFPRIPFVSRRLQLFRPDATDVVSVCSSLSAACRPWALRVLTTANRKRARRSTRSRSRTSGRPREPQGKKLSGSCNQHNHTGSPKQH